MKTIVCLLPFFILVSCNQRPKPVVKRATVSSPIAAKPANSHNAEKIQYSPMQLEAYLDSIGRLPVQPLANKVAFGADSVFKNQHQMNRLIPPEKLQKLKLAIRSGVIDVNTAKSIFGDFKIDSACTDKGVVPITFYPFDKNKHDFNEYAISIGEKWHCTSNPLYFLKAGKIIARHNGYSHYGLDLKHYKDNEGKTVVYYRCEFDDGSGIWWNNFFFYKYDGDKLIPVLNEVQNANLISPSPWGIRTLWLESFIQKTNPLTIKMVYNQHLPGIKDPFNGPKIIDDSTTVRYLWDEHSKQLQGQYAKSKISKAQILSYYLVDNEMLFINSYYKQLKRALHNERNKKSTLNYLNDVKNDYGDK